MDELDYVKEAQNATAFAAAMEERGLDAVTTAAVVPEFSSGRVLPTPATHAIWTQL